MSYIFQFSLLGLVLYSLLLVIAVPVLYSSAVESSKGNSIVLIGGGVWVVFVIIVGVLSSFAG